MLDVTNGTSNARWIEAPPLITPRAYHSTVVSGSSVCVLGGVGPDGEVLASVECYADGAWSVSTSLPVPTANATVVQVAQV